MKIRSITTFAKLSLPADADQIARLGAFAQRARQTFAAGGYEVQTLRLATGFPEGLGVGRGGQSTLDDVAALEDLCHAAGFEYISLGPVDVEPQPTVRQVLEAAPSVFLTCTLVAPGTGVINGRRIRFAARTMVEAAAIEGGFGNLRFAALANTPAGTPFFPAAYWFDDAPAFAVATESADLAVEACTPGVDAATAHARLQASVTAHGQALRRLGEQVAASEQTPFLGIDFSLAPYPIPEVSIGGALEALTGQPLGSAGTLAAAAMLTDAVQRADFPKVGFCGLMLPVLEDLVFAQRAAEGRLSLGDLLQWSAVCGTGLDTVPLAGDVTEEALAAVLYDVAAQSVRLGKPLTARLMPLPGKAAGDPVHFDFAYFADGGVLPLHHEARPGGFSTAPDLQLTSYRP